MRNYALEWKKNSKFRQVPYEDFVVDFRGVTDGVYFEKVDGMLGGFVYDGKDAFFQTTTGKEMRDLPVISEYLAMFKKFKVKSAMVMGELVAKKNNTILPFNETQSIVKTSYKESNKPLVHHYPFDIVEWNGQKPNFKQATAFLSKNLGGLQHITMPKMVTGNIKQFRKLYNSIKEDNGFDGIVARVGDGKIYKVKFTNTADVAVIGAGGIGMPAWIKGQVSYLLTSFVDKQGLFRTSSKLGTGFTAQKRAEFFRYINQNKLYEKNGELFVDPKLIIEVKYFRYRITDTPAYKLSDGVYQPIGNKKSITFSHSSFERSRPDKKPNRFDTRLEQIPEFEE